VMFEWRSACLLRLSQTSVRAET